MFHFATGRHAVHPSLGGRSGGDPTVVAQKLMSNSNSRRMDVRQASFPRRASREEREFQ